MTALPAFEATPETDRGRTLYRMLLAVHAGIRGELVSVERLAAAVVDGLSADGLNQELEALRNNSQLWQFQVGCLRYCRFVHAHHHAEDTTSSASWRRRTRRSRRSSSGFGLSTGRFRLSGHGRSSRPGSDRRRQPRRSPRRRRCAGGARGAPPRSPRLRRAKRRRHGSTAARPAFLQSARDADTDPPTKEDHQ